MTMAYVAIAVAVGTTLVSANQQEIANRKQKEAAEKQQAMEEIKASRARQEAVREARAVRAQLASQSVQSGTVGSSGASGAMSSVQSQLGSNVAFQNTQTAFSQSIASDQADIFQAQANIQKGQALGSLAQSGISYYKKYGKK